jgi:hypothetical protein
VKKNSTDEWNERNETSSSWGWFWLAQWAFELFDNQQMKPFSNTHTRTEKIIIESFWHHFSIRFISLFCWNVECCRLIQQQVCALFFFLLFLLNNLISSFNNKETLWIETKRKKQTKKNKLFGLFLITFTPNPVFITKLNLIPQWDELF